jgi:protein-disulfide isomerase
MTRPLLLAALALLAACGAEEAETQAVVADEPVQLAEAAQEAEVATDAGEAPAAEAVPAPEGSLAASEMALGAEDAPVTIVEYASVTCPGCAAFHAAVFPEIKERFIDTGEVRFVYREFPTAPQNLAYAGFVLARCAATDTGAPAYFAMVDALYERQRDWIYAPNPGEALEGIFAQVGFDRSAMEQCLRRQDIIDAINENVLTGQEAGVDSTPSFFIDGEPMERARSAEGYIEQIEAAIAARG